MTDLLRIFHFTTTLRGAVCQFPRLFEVNGLWRAVRGDFPMTGRLRCLDFQPLESAGTRTPRHWKVPRKFSVLFAEHCGNSSADFFARYS